jgi:hypothetical protein
VTHTRQSYIRFSVAGVLVQAVQIRPQRQVDRGGGLGSWLLKVASARLRLNSLRDRHHTQKNGKFHTARPGSSPCTSLALSNAHLKVVIRVSNAAKCQRTTLS